MPLYAWVRPPHVSAFTEANDLFAKVDNECIFE